MKIIAEIFKLSYESPDPVLYAVDDSDNLIEGVSRTLLDLISELYSDILDKFVADLNLAKDGKHVRNDPKFPDWNVNDKLVWIGPPETEEGYVLISNENVPDYSEEYGVPEKFSIEQVFAAIAHLNHFRAICLGKSDAELLDIVGMKFETEI